MSVKPFTYSLLAEAESFACNTWKRCGLGMSGISVSNSRQHFKSQVSGS